MKIPASKIFLVICLFSWGIQTGINVYKIKHPLFLIKVKENWMSPILDPGDRVIATRKFNNLKEGDLVILKIPREKREKVSVWSSVPIKLVIFKVASVGSESAEIKGRYFDISEDKIFLVGENKEVLSSWDSRFKGPYNKEEIYGKVLQMIKK